MLIYVATNGNWHFNYATDRTSAYAWTYKRNASGANGKCPAAEEGWFNVGDGKWVQRSSAEFSVTTKVTTTTTQKPTTTTKTTTASTTKGGVPKKILIREIRIRQIYGRATRNF